LIQVYQIEPRRIIAIDDARPLEEPLNVDSSKGGTGTYVVMISRNNHTPRREAATPRTAEEIMCVIGEVTLIERRLAMLMRKPNKP